MNATATLADTLPSAIRDQLLARAVRAQPCAYLSLFVNTQRREGKNDPQFTGRMDIQVARLQEEIAIAIAKGHTNIQVYTDVWTNDDGGPVMTGRARNVVPDAKRFEPKPQVAQPDAAVDETAPSDETSVTP